MTRQGSRTDKLSLPESDVLPQKFDPDRQIPESGGTPQLSGSKPRNLATNGGYPHFGQKVTPEPKIWPGTRNFPFGRVWNPNFGLETGSGTPKLGWKVPSGPKTRLESGLEPEIWPGTRNFPKTGPEPRN